MKLLRFGLGLIAGCALLIVWTGFAGAWHPVGDSLSLLRMGGGVLCLLLMVSIGGVIWRVILGLSAVAAFLTTLPLFFGGTAGDTLMLYSKNIWYANRELAALAADIIDSDADVVTLQEVSERNNRLLDRLAADYPHQHLCPFSTQGGIAVLSKYPIIDQKCTARRGMAAAQVRKDDTLIWVGSIHLSWPYPYSNSRAADAVAAVIAELEGPVVLAGDFNIFPWAASVRQLQQATKTQIIQPIRPTYRLGGVPLFLDHVHAPGGGKVSYRTFLGSDHRGVLAQLSLAP